jgi:hypothetical protein
MFERYTEKARRTIFFARYEASQFGSPIISPEHTLLGLLREDPQFMRTFLSAESVSTIRPQIENATPVRKKISTKSDLPLSQENKLVLAYAAKEADALGYAYIGPEHLLIGLLCVEQSLAAKLLTSRHVTLSILREHLTRTPEELRKHWPEGDKPWSRKKHRLLRAINIFLLFVLALFFLQVWVKNALNELSHMDAVFYAIGLAAVSTASCLVTWRLRQNRTYSTRKTQTLWIIAAFALIVGLFPIIFESHPYRN